MTYTLTYRRQSDRQPMVIDLQAHSLTEAENAAILQHGILRPTWCFMRLPNGTHHDYEPGISPAPQG